jgi:hypothetical protein
MVEEVGSDKLVHDGEVPPGSAPPRKRGGIVPCFLLRTRVSSSRSRFPTDHDAI